MRNVQKGLTEIRMTNAQMHSDAYVRQKNTMEEPRPQFKLKRFLNVDPRTNTTRGPISAYAKMHQKTASMEQAKT